MKLSANQAAKEIGKSVPTITRAINSGRLTAVKKENGGYEIDPAELFRVWPRVTAKDNAQGNTLNDTTPHETRVLEVKLDAERAMLEQVRAQLADALEQRDKWQQQAEAQQRLLEAPKGEQAPTPPATVKRGIWARLTGQEG